MKGYCVFLNDSRAIAPVVAYVLLIAMGLTASGVVYTGVRDSVQTEDPVFCPDTVDIAIKNYQCTLDGSFCIDIENKGLFQADGFEVRVDNKTPQSFELFTIDFAGENVTPGQTLRSSYSFPIVHGSGPGTLDTVSYVEVQPYQIINGERHLCDSVLSQNVYCAPTGPDCAALCTSDSDCPSGVCVGGVCVDCRDAADCTDDGNECTQAACVTNSCVQNPLVGNSCGGGTGFCDSMGVCIPSNCTIHTDCDSCGTFGSNYCIGDSIYHNQTCTTGMCTLGSCSTNSSFVNETLVQDCTLLGQVCSNGACVAPPPVKPLSDDLFDVVIVIQNGAGDVVSENEVLAARTLPAVFAPSQNFGHVGVVFIASNYALQTLALNPNETLVNQSIHNLNGIPGNARNLEAGLAHALYMLEAPRDRDDTVYPDYIILVSHALVNYYYSNVSWGAETPYTSVDYILSDLEGFLFPPYPSRASDFSACNIVSPVINISCPQVIGSDAVVELATRIKNDHGITILSFNPGTGFEYGAYSEMRHQIISDPDYYYGYPTPFEISAFRDKLVEVINKTGV